MFLNGHGGRCCGITHMYGFPYGDLREHQKKWVRNSLYKVDPASPTQSIMAEVVLLDEQLTKANRKFLIDELGFVLVTRFKNRNSGNMVNVLHHCVRSPING